MGMASAAGLRAAAFCCVAARALAWPSFLVRPQAYFARVQHPQANLMLMVENVGHAFTWRRVRLMNETELPEVMATRSEGACVFADEGRTRCLTHTWASLQQMYVLRTDEEFEQETKDAYFVVSDEPQPVPADAGGAKLREAASAFEDEATAEHLALAAKAAERPLGRHVFPACNEVCPPGKCNSNSPADLVWLLRPLWGLTPPRRVRALNVGCRDFGRGDPLHSLHAWQGDGADAEVSLAGLFVDADAAAAAEARRVLAEHRDVHVESVFLTPHNVRSLLQEHLMEHVDIVKVDVDSFDVSLLDTILSALTADVLIVEFNYIIPPPFRYAQHYAQHEAGTAVLHRGIFGASLAYLVEFMGSRGYLLYRMDSADTFWVHQRHAATFEAAVEHLRFPVDSWACYLRTRFPEHRDFSGYMPAAYTEAHTRDWLLEGDTYEALGRLWRNLSLWTHVPFTLDLAGLTSPAAEPDESSKQT